MRCPQCKNKILQKAGDAIRVRTQGPITFQDGLCKSKCYWCKSDIALPLEIQPDTQIPSERFVLRGERKS